MKPPSAPHALQSVPARSILVGDQVFLSPSDTVEEVVMATTTSDGRTDLTFTDGSMRHYGPGDHLQVVPPANDEDETSSRFGDDFEEVVYEQRWSADRRAALGASAYVHAGIGPRSESSVLETAELFFSWLQAEETR